MTALLTFIGAVVGIGLIALLFFGIALWCHMQPPQKRKKRDGGSPD